MEWKTLQSDRLVNHHWLKVDKNKVALPNGMVVDDFYTVSLLEASAIVALTPNREIILKKEYRYALREDLIEIPAGGFDFGEDGLTVAKRELLEETGYVSDEWEYLGATVESSSKLTNHMHIFFANNCRKVAEQKLDATEELDVLVLPFEKAIEMVMTNEICCNSSAHGILKVARRLGV